MVRQLERSVGRAVRQLERSVGRLERSQLFQTWCVEYLYIQLHYRKLFKFRSRLLVRHNFFTNRVVNLWNSLPADVISAPTVALFKKNLDDLWRTTRYGHSQRPAA